MRRGLRLILLMLGAFFVCVVLGMTLLLAAFSLPTAQMASHMSPEVLLQEGSSPKIYYLGTKSQLDNFTDALMLLSAEHPSKTSLLDSALKVYRLSYKDKTPNETLTSLATDSHQESKPKAIDQPYPKYWHGYLIILKPLLLFISYQQIRFFNFLVVLIVSSLVVFLFYKRELQDFLVPYLLSVFCIDPLAVSQSMQFMDIYVLFSAICICYLQWNKWFNEKFERIALLFFISGCLTSFFDLLTYPLLTFGMPAVIFVITNKARFQTKSMILITALFSWLVGYIGMWGAKWGIGTLFTNSNVIHEALASVGYRTALTDNHGEAIKALSVIGKQLQHLLSLSFALCLIFVFTNLKSFKDKLHSKFNPDIYLLLLISLIPFLWYCVAGNHSYLHHWMTYRNLAMTIFALLSAFILFLDKNKLLIISKS